MLRPPTTARRDDPESDRERCASPRPLYLTEAEGEALLLLCTATPVIPGEIERVLFAKVGKLLRSFRNESVIHPSG